MCDWAAKRKKVPDWHVTSHRRDCGAQCFVSHPNVVRLYQVTVSKKRRKISGNEKIHVGANSFAP